MNITQADLDRIAKSNPDIDIRDQMNPEELSAAVSNGSETGHVSIMPGSSKSSMEHEFLALWTDLGGPDLEEELKFHTSRKWRLDFCHLPSRVAIELEGGVYSRGRHTRGAGFVRDCEKYNAATRCGYTIFRLATGMVRVEHMLPIIEYIKAHGTTE